MSNMGYCRFQNTLRDLKDCAEALEESGFDIDKLSEEERLAVKRLMVLCQKLATDYYDSRGFYRSRP